MLVACYKSEYTQEYHNVITKARLYSRPNCHCPDMSASPQYAVLLIVRSHTVVIEDNSRIYDAAN